MTAFLTKVKVGLAIAGILIAAVAVAGWEEGDGPVHHTVDLPRTAKVVVVYLYAADPSCCAMAHEWQIGKNGKVVPDEKINDNPFMQTGLVYPGDRIEVMSLAPMRIDMVNCWIEVDDVKIDVARNVWPGVRARCVGFAP
jgi:hypothetical protein